MLRAFSTSSAVPWAISTNFPALTDVSYFTTLSLGMPMLYSAAPKALKPPTTIAPSSAPTIQVTTEPAATTGPIPGINKRADPIRRPQSPPQNAPNLPQYFILAPVL